MGELVQIGRATLYLGDCRDVLPTLAAKSIDLIAADLPYETTDCKWDKAIPFPLLWAEYSRLLRPDRAVVLTASQPFSSALTMSNPDWFRFEWIWKKNAGSNFGTVKSRPMKEHEAALVFSKGRLPYFPIMQERAASGAARVKTVVNYRTNAEVYQNGRLDREASSVRPELRYPSSVQNFNRERGLHPTQKPVALMDYLIRSHSEPGWTVLDNVMGSGTTGVAALRAGRAFIGIERESKYFEIACRRMEDAQRCGTLFDGEAA